MSARTIGLCVASAGLIGAATLVASAVPSGFQVRVVATGLQSPKGLDAPLWRAGVGPMGGNLYVAESGANQVVEIDLRTGEMISFAPSTGEFPVGLACFGGPWGKNMYIGNAMGYGVDVCDVDGYVAPFALLDLEIADLDFGSGQFGKDLYAAEWQMGRIWRVDRRGNEEIFAALPGADLRYLEFSHGGPFGKYLYFTDYGAGDIYRVDHTGTIEFFANTGTTGLEGLAFSPGGAFEKYLYVGDVESGQIFRVDPEGNVEIFAEGFEGVADIIFLPGKRGGFRMYFVDGQFEGSVYEISLE